MKRTFNYYQVIYKGIRSQLYLILFLTIGVMSLQASSHREAPLISGDPLADNVDLYAFRSPDNPDMITIIATYIPMQLPYGGPNYYNFGENVRYEIHVDNDAAIPGDEITYRFTFKMINEDPTTFFNIRLGKQNLKATYTLERSMDGGQTFQTIVTDGVVPPTNIGPRSIAGGAGLGTSYSSLFNGAITQASTGEQVFAGPTDDPFFVDLGGIFDLGNAPRQVGNSVDNLACMNVSALAIQVPISTLKKAGAADEPTSILDSDYVIGVWASASRLAIKTISTEGETYSGDWVQVSRLGMPLTNEAVIPVGQKDFWNSISPYDEISETTLDEYFYNPELALYMDDAQFGGAVPALSPLRIQKNSLGAFDFSNGGDGLFGLKGSEAVAGTALDDAVFGTLLLPAAGKPRSVDLWPAFHTGVPNVIPYQLATGKEGNPLAAGKPFVNNFLPNGGDMLRLNMAVPVTPRDDANFSSLGLIQAAAIGLTVAPFNTNSDLEFIPNMDGFPNGRRLEDDVTRIELQAVSGVVLAAIGLWYDDYEVGGSPVTQDLLNVLTFSTGVEANDRAFSGSFPYLAMPFSGAEGCGSQYYDGGATSGIDVVRDVYFSSNTQSKVGILSANEDKSFSINSFSNQAMDADGIYYDEETDVLYEVSRSSNAINSYNDLNANLSEGFVPALSTTSTSDFINGREMGAAGDRLVVAQDANDANGMTNKLYEYKFDENGATLNKVFDLDINLWGIHIDVNTLYAVVDNSNQIAEYLEFFKNEAGTLSANNIISIEGLVRTHGISYDPLSDQMFLTDVGEASSATDGAIVVINNWEEASSDGEVSLSEQVRIEGSETLLGNPVDIGYDRDLNVIYVAERANGGGRILVFSNATSGGNISPIFKSEFAGASALYVEGFTSDESPITGIFDTEDPEVELTLSPNPASDFLRIDMKNIVDISSGMVIEVYDISGQSMMKVATDRNTKTLDISRLQSGMYILNIVSGNQRIESKFMKF